MPLYSSNMELSAVWGQSRAELWGGEWTKGRTSSASASVSGLGLQLVEENLQSYLAYSLCIRSTIVIAGHFKRGCCGFSHLIIWFSVKHYVNFFLWKVVYKYWCWCWWWWHQPFLLPGGSVYAGSLVCATSLKVSSGLGTLHLQLNSHAIIHKRQCF